MIVKGHKYLFLLVFLLLALSGHVQYIKGVIFSSVQHSQYSRFNTDGLFIHFSKTYDLCFVFFSKSEIHELKVRFRITQTL